MKGESFCLAVGQKTRMNRKHRDVGCSAGLHLFQELSPLGQQLAHALLFLEAAAEYCPCFQRPRFDCSSPSAVRGPVLTNRVHSLALFHTDQPTGC
jgi:hypothetical protein